MTARVPRTAYSPAEFETAHIPGAINVPLPLLEDNTETLAARLPEDVVLVCQSGGITDTCAMGRALSALPYNQGAHSPDATEVLAQLPPRS